MNVSPGTRPGPHRYILTVPGRGYRFVADVKARADAGARAEAPSVSSIRNLAVLPFTPLVAEHRDAALELGMGCGASASRLSMTESTPPG